MTSVDLAILQRTRKAILMSETAALLQNYGKVSSKFITHYASDIPFGYDYNLKRVADPAQTITLIRGNTEITSSQGVNLVTTLANDHIWGGLQSLAQQLGTSITGTSSKASRTARRVKDCGQILIQANVASPSDVRTVANCLISALYLAELFQTTPVSAFGELDAKDKDGKQQQFLSQTRIKLLNADVSFNELLLLMWDNLHGHPDDQQRDAVLEFWTGRNASLQRYLATCHGIISGIEKESAGSKNGQLLNETFIASAFGWENSRRKIDPQKLDARRDRWLKAVLQQTAQYSGTSASGQLEKIRTKLVTRSEAVLRKALGETQRANNDVTLWDYVSTIASLFKAALAKAVLENTFIETGKLKWRLLSIRYDGLEYLSRAHHISDLLARSAALDAALDEVKAVIEVEYPLGNEIYRDENGSVLIVPHVQDGDRTIELLAQECGEGDQRGTLERLLLNRFSEAKHKEREPLGGEVHPIIALSDEFLGKKINLTRAKGWQNPTLQPDPEKVSEWWRDKNKHGEVCTVCGLRSLGYGASDGRHPETGEKGWTLHLEENHHLKKQPRDCEVCKAQDRRVCWVCMERRDDRSKKWATNVDGSLKRTIWTDEVADDNGRLALVIGRFVLDCWLDGTLIPTMQKSASFARIQRCWRTTLEFWQEIEKGKDGLPELIGCNRERRIITAKGFDPDELGPYHVYDLDWNGRRLSIVWDKKNRYFITADNLEYFKKTAGDIEALKGKVADILEPSAHLSRRETKTWIAIRDVPLHPEPYSPFIPVMAQPSLFMALVPADKALEVVRKIKCKYEKEMGKVRDRLPIHVGVVFAPRRTPVRALLEAGRRMLEMPDRWEKWKIKTNEPDAKYHNVAFENGVSWKIRAVMGDDVTPDRWYPHFLRRLAESKNKQNLAITVLKHARDLDKGDEVYVRPSRFDFEFLDTAGRRFEISYDSNGRRRGSGVRPFLLENLNELDNLWDWLIDEKKTGRKKLSTSHLQHLESTLASYVTEWFDGDIAKAARDTTYQTFAKSVLHRLDPKWWKSLGEEQKKSFEAAVTSGLIFDLLELRMHILKEKSDTD